MYVKRINGVEGLTDEDVFNYYFNKIIEHGGESLEANKYFDERTPEEEEIVKRLC